MISEAMMGASALKTAFDMAKALKDVSDATIRNAAVIELQEKILSAQEAQFALIKRVDDVEKQVATFETNGAQMKRYQLKDFGGGTFAYELKESEARGEPIAYVPPAIKRDIFPSSNIRRAQADKISMNVHHAKTAAVTELT